MQFILDDDPKVNEQRLKDVRSIADNANTDGTCFAYGELFSLTETIEVLNYNSLFCILIFIVCWIVLLVMSYMQTFFTNKLLEITLRNTIRVSNS